MDLTFLTEYISPIALAICLCVGYIIKNFIPGDQVNKYIPLIVGVVGILITSWVSMSFTPETVCLGLVSGLASTGLYEAFKQLIGGKN